MSTGQIVGGVVGAVVGFIATGFSPMGAVKGAYIGYTLGTIVDAPKGPDVIGPRLQDLTAQTSTYGAIIPRVYGTTSLLGNVFYIENNRLKETSRTQTEGGKGGGGQDVTTFSYSATFAVSLCEGPIIGIRRIWVGPNLIYDVGVADVSQLIASNNAARYFTLYTGTETQMPDPRMQAVKGADCPAYRGIAYLMFSDFALKDYGNSMMGVQVKVEVVCAGDVENFNNNIYPLPFFNQASNIEYNGKVYCAVGDDGSKTKIYTSLDGQNWVNSPLSSAFNNLYTSIFNSFKWNGKIFCLLLQNPYGVMCSATSPDGKVWTLTTTSIVFTSGATRGLEWNGNVFCSINVGPYRSITSPDGINWTASSETSFSETYEDLSWDGEKFFSASSNYGKWATSTDGLSWDISTMPNHVWIDYAWSGLVYCVVGYGYCVTSPDGITWTLQTIPLETAWKIIWTGEVFLVIDALTDDFITSPDGVIWTLHSGVYAHNWQSLIWNGGAAIALSASVVRFFFPHSLSVTAPDLSSIIKSECLKSNFLQDSDIDVSMIDSEVRGFKIASVAAIRSAIETLRGAWPFDVIQSGYQIKFVPRGEDAIDTVPFSDLDARENDQGSGVQIINSREMDSVLPSTVSIGYLDVDREYDVGEQYAERLNTEAINKMRVEMALSMTAQEAAEKAQVLLYMYWLERYDISFKLPPSYNYLEPSDVINLVSEDTTYNLRITNINYTSDNRLECSAKYNNPATYVPVALGVEGNSTGQVISIPGPTRYELLDIPLVDDSLDIAGFPVAMYGFLDGWNGGVLMRSDDSGQTWTQVTGFTRPGSTVGMAVNAIGTRDTTMIDKTSLLNISINHPLYNVTEAQMLNGANYFAYGKDNRWEIIAAQNCVIQTNGSYILSDMLRGRFGTEWACGLHAVNDTLVYLDKNSLQYVAANVNTIGMNRDYRGITNGENIDSDTSLTFSYDGVNLECFSPVYLNGNRNPSTNDWTLTWIRRTRVGGALRDYVDASLGEATEAYETDIYTDGTYTAVKRTISSSTPTLTYSSANQVTDFGSNQSTLYVSVYQLSAAVGRGYPLTQSITR